MASKPYVKRIFTLKFTRRLILVALLGPSFIAAVFLLLRFFPEKAFEFSSPYFGTIKATATTASNYLTEIQGIKQRVEGQRDTIDAAFANAAGAQRAASNANESVVFAREQLESMKTNSDLLLAIAGSFADDRPAFDSLKAMRFSEDPMISRTAWEAVGTIINTLDARYKLEKVYVTAKWDVIGINPETNTLEQLINFYGRRSPAVRIFLLNYIAGADRFPKYEKLDFVAQVIEHEQSLSTVNAACEIMGDESKMSLNVMGTHDYIDWWNQNKLKYADTNAATVQH
jgi:hypothetical protein